MPTSRLTKAHSASLIFGFVLAATILFPVTIVAFQKGEPEKSIAELVDQLDTTALRRHFFAHVLNNDFERILLQIVSRGGPDAEAHLKAKLKHDENQITELRAEMEKRGNNSREPDEFLEMEYTLVDRLCNNLELLTALRRVQNKPDPLVIELELPKELHATTRSLPTITATLNSADVERIPIWLDLTPISHGSHRQAQWLFEVTDETGTLLPTRAKTRRSIEIAAANKADGPLSFGKSVQSRLPMSDFVNIRKPGDY
ncbi:MAG: hypothetical protein NT069_04000, partial [Planctomycetota bacterium]|nr:hypothetical protein [Planctomycetota bacterium]